jgi:hypothetical protein
MLTDYLAYVRGSHPKFENGGFVSFYNIHTNLGRIGHQGFSDIFD